MDTQPMKDSEMGRFVCVAHGGCLHSPNITIRSNGVWVRQGPGGPFSSAHRDCFEAWEARESRKGVVHIRSAVAPQESYISGRGLERAEAEARRWVDQGYEVAPVPADDRKHQYGRPCPACSGDA